MEEASIYFNRIVPLASYSLAFALISLTEQNYRQLVLLFWRVVGIGCMLTVASGIYEARRIGFDFSEFVQCHKVQIQDIYYAFNILYGWSGTGHPSYNALWQVAGLSCIFFLIDKKMISWLEFIFGTLLILFITVITQSRIGIVMWGIVTVAGIIYLLRKNKYLLWSGITAIALMTIAIGCTKMESIRSFYTDPTRVALLQIASDYLHADPWKGCGLGGMTYDYMESVIGYEFKSWWPQYADSTTMYPHNQFLGDWMQSGIMGLIVSLGLLVCGFYEAIKQRSFMALSFLIAVMFFMLIEMPFHFLSGTTIIAFFLCFVLSHRIKPKSDTAPDKPACDSSTRTK